MLSTCQMRALLKIASNEFEMRSQLRVPWWSQVTFELHQAKVFFELDQELLFSRFLATMLIYSSFKKQRKKCHLSCPMLDWPGAASRGTSPASKKAMPSIWMASNIPTRPGWLDLWDPDPMDQWQDCGSWGDWRAQEVDSELHEGRKRPEASDHGGPRAHLAGKEFRAWPKGWR